LRKIEEFLRLILQRDFSFYASQPGEIREAMDINTLNIVEIETVPPPLELNPEGIAELADELVDYHAEFAELYYRLEPEQFAYLGVRGRFDVGDPQAARPGFQANTGQAAVEIHLLEDPRLPLPEKSTSAARLKKRPPIN
jgi:hypothetical protein